MTCYIVDVDVWTNSHRCIDSHAFCGFNRAYPTLQKLCGRAFMS